MDRLIEIVFFRKGKMKDLVFGFIQSVHPKFFGHNERMTDLRFPGYLNEGEIC